MGEWSKLLTVAILVAVFSLAGPASALVYNFDYAATTSTVNSPPSVVLQTGISGSSSLSSVESNAATVSTTAGLTYYESANAQTSTLARDGSASSSFTTTLSSTVASGSSLVATGDNAQRKDFFCQTRAWSFYSDGTNIVWKTSTDGLTWTSATTVRNGVQGNHFSTELDCTNTKLYYAFANGGGTQFFFRSGTLNTGGTITWDAAEAAITGSFGTEIYPTITKDTSAILWITFVSVNGAGSGTHGNYIEVWSCSASCSTSTNWSSSTNFNINGVTAVANRESPLLNTVTSGKLSLVYAKSSVGAQLGIKTYSGTTWNAEVLTTSSYNTGEYAATAVSGTTYFAGVKSDGTVVYWSCAYPCASAPSETTLSSATTNTVAAISSNGAADLVVVYGGGSSVLYKQSANVGSTWSSEQLEISSTSYNSRQLSLSHSEGNGYYQILWSSSTTITFDSLKGAPSIIQTKGGCTFTGTSGTCAFASNTAAGSTIVVVASATSGTTVSMVTDSQNLIYSSKIVGKSVAGAGDAEMWWACAASSAAADTLTVAYGSSVTTSIHLYELSKTSCLAPATSTGSGSGATSATVSSYTPTAYPPAFLIIGEADSTCGSGCTVSGGSSYTVPTNGNTAINSGNEATTEYITNLGTSETTTFSFSSSSSYNEISVAFADPSMPATTLTTISANDVIYVTVALLNAGSQTVTSVTDDAGLTYTQRQIATLGTTVRVETWYAIATSAMTSDTVTAKLSSAVTSTIIAVGISGANTASPFDPNVSSAPSLTGTGTSASTTITTTFSHDYLFGVLGMNAAPALTAGSGFSIITSVAQGTSVQGSIEDQKVTDTQSGTTVSFSWSGSQSWAIIADALIARNPSPTTDTSLTSPGSSGSFSLAASDSMFLWSPAYTSGGTLYSGSWLLDLWASKATSAGTLTVSISVVDSTGAITATVLSTGTTASIPTTKTEVQTTFSGSGATIPTNGRIMVVLTDGGTATTVTIYWGSGQTTNFQTPYLYDYVLAIDNPTSTSYTVSLSLASSSGISQLTNLTIMFVSPFSKQIIVTSGSVSQSSGSAVTLAGSGNIHIRVGAQASSVGSASLVLSLKVKPSSSTAYAGYTINLSVG